jgi:hypothetical protein
VDNILSGHLPDNVHVNDIAASRQSFSKWQLHIYSSTSQEEVLISDRNRSPIRGNGQDNVGQVDIVRRGIGNIDAALDPVAIDVGLTFPVHGQGTNDAQNESLLHRPGLTTVA